MGQQETTYDVVSTLEIDPKELNKGRSLTWTGEVAEAKAKIAFKGDDSRQLPTLYTT
jgi:hypothetical protein